MTSVCIACPLRTTNAGGINSCNMCSAGSFGTTVAAGVMATDCAPCAAGTYTNLAGQASCLTCPAAVTNDGGDTSCNQCAPGYEGATVSSGSTAACIICQPGMFKAGRGPGPCLKTEMGGYAALSGQSAATLCAAGSYSQSTNAKLASTCLTCPAGHYCPTDGTFKPTPCPANSYSAATGATSSATCQPCTSAAAGFGCGAGSKSATPAVCPIGYYCVGGLSSAIACYPSAACAVTGLTAQPPCYWQVATLAGSEAGASGSANGLGSAATFYEPVGVSLDPAFSTIYVGDYRNNLLRKITPTGTVTTRAAGILNMPYAVPVDSVGNVYIVDGDNHRIQLLTPASTVSTVAGRIGVAGDDNGVGTLATFNRPTGLVLTSGAVAYVLEETGCRIRTVNVATRSVASFAGSGVCGFLDSTGTLARFNNPTSLVWHSDEKLYVADNANHRIRSVDTTTASVTTLAGSTAGTNDGTGTSARFSGPRGIAIDVTTNTLYVTQWTGGSLRSIGIATRLVNTIAGKVGSSSALNGFGTNAGFYNPIGIDISASGALYLADFSNHRIASVACVPCPASYFCSSGEPVICPIGYYCPLSSLSPIACSAGTYNGAVGGGSISACLSCSTGTYSNTAGRSSCIACNPTSGTTTSAGLVPGPYSCNTCSAVRIALDDLRAARARPHANPRPILCIPLRKPQQGYYSSGLPIAVPKSNGATATCAACPANFYTSLPSQTACTSCATVAPLGSVTNSGVAGTSTSCWVRTFAPPSRVPRAALANSDHPPLTYSNAPPAGRARP